ncbi:MAG: hypothetical protein RMJ19_03225 [Gemmatales bacterium]|nr:hypothetical protein [Gemmatales bacterium]MDW8174660.1 hypothetical protein [Gemmatales bacterium]
MPGSMRQLILEVLEDRLVPSVVSGSLELAAESASEDHIQYAHLDRDVTYEIYPEASESSPDGEFSAEYLTEETGCDDGILWTLALEEGDSGYPLELGEEVSYDAPAEDEFVYSEEVSADENYEWQDGLIDLPCPSDDLSPGFEKEQYYKDGKTEVWPVRTLSFSSGDSLLDGANYRFLAFASAGDPVGGLGGEDEAPLFSAAADGGITAEAENASLLGLTDVHSQGTWNHYDLARWLAWLAQGSNERLNGDLFQWLKRRNDLVG